VEVAGSTPVARSKQKTMFVGKFLDKKPENKYDVEKERWLSGLRRTLGKRVRGSNSSEGSNPSLSAGFRSKTCREVLDCKEVYR